MRDWIMMQPTGRNPIRVQSSTSTLIRWRNIDLWMRIGDKRKIKNTANITAARKLCFQQKLSTAFQKYKETTNSLSLSPTK